MSHEDNGNTEPLQTCSSMTTLVSVGKMQLIWTASTVVTNLVTFYTFTSFYTITMHAHNVKIKVYQVCKYIYCI